MTEKKIARVCWNSNYWQAPSGLTGKSTNKNTYERQHGFGHEEWLLDISKIIDGYHYAYIQGINPVSGKYVGSTLNLSLYTINGKTKERFWIGEVDNVEVISTNESRKIHGQYEKKGWIKEMRAQLLAVSADVDRFNATDPEYFVCIRFRPEAMKLLDEPESFQSSDPAVTSDYYKLKDFNGLPSEIQDRKFKFIPGGVQRKDKTTASYTERVGEIDLFHNRIQKAVDALLVKKHGRKSVSCELKTGHGTKIDVAVETEKSHVFYEIKTCNTSKQNIREALPQLLEYAHYPNDSRASKLVVIGPAELSRDSRTYLEKLRKLYRMRIFYQYYDPVKNTLGPEE